MYKKISLVGMLVLGLSLFSPFTTRADFNSQAAFSFADAAFKNVWNRADSLVAGGAVNRSWLWGNGFSYSMNELYRQSPNGLRQVQYFDKARMEINNPSSAQDRFYVTNGLLVKELISGRVALGDTNDNVDIRRPAEAVAVAGDPLEINPNAPTYASFAAVASLFNDKRIVNQNGSDAIGTINKKGETGSNPSLAGIYKGLKLVYYDDNLGHNIPEIFWNFMNSRGNIVNPNGQVVQDAVMDWIKDLGFPLSEAYWTRAVVSGKEQDVLVQPFERRVLTYTPSNNDPYKVEMGNVGLHYFSWRYQGKQSVSANVGTTPFPMLKGQHAAPGINAEIFGQPSGQVNSYLNDLHLHWVRQQVRWSDIEPSKGQRIYGPLDQVVNSTASNNTKLMLSVVKSPVWANPNGGMPLNPQDYTDLMSDLSNRYKGKVAAYEIWNEENLASEAGKPIDVARYVQILKAGYLAVKEYDPQAAVILGGLSPVGFTDVNAVVDDVQYMKQLYAFNGGEARKYFDAVGGHPGSNNNPPDALYPDQPGPGPGWTNDPSFYFRRIEQIRQVMVDGGDGDKQVWLTEFGWDSSPTPPEGYEYARQISEDKQAQYILRAFQKGNLDYQWMGPMLLWQLNFALPTVTSNSNDEKNGWGILRRDGSKRPSYNSVQQYALSL